MTKWRCKEADVWTAAHLAGTLGDAERIRLQEHLDACSGCRRRAAGVGALVQLLREQTPQLSDSRREQLWRAVQRGPMVESAQTAAASEGHAWWQGMFRLPAWMGASAVAFTATLLLALWLWPGAPPAAPTLPWVAEGLEGTLRPGQELRVPRDGRMVLRSPHETVVAVGGSKLRLPRAADGPLELRHGELRIQTRVGQHSRLMVRLGSLQVRPLGTAYRLRWPGSGLHVAVDRGQVEVRSDAGRRVQVAAGQGLHWGRALRALTRTERRELAALWGRSLLAAAPAVAPPVVAASPPVVAASPPVVAASPPVRAATPVAAPVVPPLARATIVRPRSRVGARKVRPTAAAKTTPRAASPAPPKTVAGGELAAIERLLLLGKTEAARRDAGRLLSRGNARAALQTLIAESWVRERHYNKACAAYLAAHAAEPASSLGATALYTAGALELEQLKRPDLAERRFTRYLDKYRQGRQREGAFYMLFRALRARGSAAAAAGVTQRYEREFPQGRYQAAMRGSAH